MLVTLSGALTRRRRRRVPTGVSLPTSSPAAALTELAPCARCSLGGYHGSWIPAANAFDGPALAGGLAPFGASPGAGIVHVLSADECGLARTADIMAYLAEQSARQCGPCRNGLPRLAQLLDDLAYERVDDDLLDEVHRMLGLVDGRGACRHPDGTARLLRSALETFAGDIEHHRDGRCDRRSGHRPQCRTAEAGMTTGTA